MKLNVFNFLQNVSSKFLYNKNCQFLCILIFIILSKKWGVNQSVELENQMVSVERVIEYSKLEPEADAETPKGHFHAYLHAFSFSFLLKTYI